jgi:hypothetical protein
MRDQESFWQRGMSLLEAVTASTVLAGLTVLIAQSMVNLSRTQEFTREQSQVNKVGDAIARGIERDALQAITVFEDDDRGRAYLAALELQPGSLLPGSLLPRSTARGYFDRDAAGTRETGNLLFLAADAGPAVIDLNGAGDRVRVDRSRFVVYHLTPAPAGAIDLARWVGVLLARHADLEAISDAARRTEVQRRLYQSGVRLAWKDGASRSEGLFRIDTNGYLSLLPPEALVPRDEAASCEQLFGPRRIAIARNRELSSPPVPRYARAEGGFPQGFEVKLDGESTGRMLLVRCVPVCRRVASQPTATEIVRLLNTGQK